MGGWGEGVPRCGDGPLEGPIRNVGMRGGWRNAHPAAEPQCDTRLNPRRGEAAVGVESSAAGTAKGGASGEQKPNGVALSVFAAKSWPSRSQKKSERRFPTMNSAFVFSVWCLSTDMKSKKIDARGFLARCLMLSSSGCQETTHPCGRHKYVCGEKEGCCCKHTGFANALMFVRIKNTSACESRGQ